MMVVPMGQLKKYQLTEDIIFIRNKVKSRQKSSIIKGLDLANGKYVILFDGDLEISTIEIKKLFKIHKKIKIASLKIEF